MCIVSTLTNKASQLGMMSTWSHHALFKEGSHCSAITHYFDAEMGFSAPYLTFLGEATNPDFHGEPPNIKILV